MELLSNRPAHASVPDKYVFPPEKRAALLDDVPCSDVALPVVDLQRAALSEPGRRCLVAEEIVKEFGFFQVVNHGVAEDVVNAFREASAEFFAMPAEEKLPYCSDDQSKPFRVASSTSYDRNQTRYWRDYLKLRCHPVTDELVGHWPAKPESFRTSLTEFSAQVHELAQTLLLLIAEGLGLDGGFFAGDLSCGDTQMNVNYYPPCPDPSVTLGLLPHCDRHLLTVLSQGDVAGLQARYRGRWLLVRPVPGALVNQLRAPDGDRHQRRAGERGAPCPHQLRRGEDLRGDAHHAQDGLPYRPRAGDGERGESGQVQGVRVQGVHGGVRHGRC